MHHVIIYLSSIFNYLIFWIVEKFTSFVHRVNMSLPEISRCHITVSPKVEMMFNKSPSHSSQFLSLICFLGNKCCYLWLEGNREMNTWLTLLNYSLLRLLLFLLFVRLQGFNLPWKDMKQEILFLWERCSSHDWEIEYCFSLIFIMTSNI
jgi:hypothetical protein